MDGLFRRGGVWWARLVVPARLRDQAGRREFAQSTGTHEHAVGKLVASVLLAGWRRQLFELENCGLDNEKLLRLVEGRHALAGMQYVTIREATQATGLDRVRLLRAASAGWFDLFYHLGPAVHGHVLPRDAMELVNPADGTEAGLVVPGPDQMPPGAQEASFPHQTLRIPDGRAIASTVLADTVDAVDLLLFDAPRPQGWFFAPAAVVRVAVDDLALPASKVEALRAALAARVAPERVDHARAERGTMLELYALREKEAMLARSQAATTPSAVGKWADKKFSEAVDGYCRSADGLPGSLASEHDQRQRRAGLMLFAEFMGDLRLAKIDGDVLRKFRDGPLKMIPGRANTLPKEIRRVTMTDTIAALKADGRAWPLLSDEMQRERMQWLFRLFEWVHSKGYLSLNPASSLRGETGLTKAERTAVKRRRSEDDEDEEGREPFTQQQLDLIFSQQHYKSGDGKHVKKPGYWYGFEYWLPLLGLYAGLRIKEASQLHLNDVKEVDGVWCLDINARTADKSVKNDQSVRQVPLHPRLVSLGFLRYCARLRSGGLQRVFPELTWSTTNAKYAKEAGRKMSAMLEKLGMPRDGNLVFHCLRHNTNNALARVPVTLMPGADENLKRYIQLRVMGHDVGKGANIQHYTTTTSAEMARLVAGVAHDLPEIKEIDIDYAVRQIQIALGKKKGSRRNREDMGPLSNESGEPDGH